MSAHSNSESSSVKAEMILDLADTPIIKLTALGATVILYPDEARELGRTLTTIADQTERFTHSPLRRHLGITDQFLDLEG